jgi:transcriptional repressor NrdR
MKCPYCGVVGESSVIDTAPDGRGTIRRRRECHACQRRFNTIERALVMTPLLVKSSGERQEFDREKLIRGIRVSCGKRPIAAADMERLVDKVEAYLQSLGQDEVSSRIVGDMVVEELKKLDPIAYIRYAIVYLRLDDLESVRAEIDKLLSDPDQS